MNSIQNQKQPRFLRIDLLVETTCRGSPTYTKITNTVSTTTDFGLCTRQWGKIVLSESISTVPLTQISCKTVFSKSQNARKAGNLCVNNIYVWIKQQLRHHALSKDQSTVGFQSIEIAKKVFVIFDNVFHAYLMSRLKKNAKIFFFTVAFFLNPLYPF